MICANMIAFGISSKATVSYDAEVEYLESTGTQYIDTGIKLDDDVGFSIKCNMPYTTSSIYPSAFGADLDDESYFFAVYEDEGVIYIGNDHQWVENNTNEVFSTKVNFMNDKVIINENTDERVTGMYTQSINANLFAFASGTDKGVKYCSQSRIYNIQISKGNQIVRDMIPVIDNNGVACMYDNVSKQCFYNQGTGEFVAGPVKYQGLCFTAEEANSTVSMTNYGNPNPVNILASTDGKAWTTFIPNETTITLANVGDKVYFKAGAGGNKSFSIVEDNGNISNNWEFALTGKIAASGNVMSLLDGEKNINKMTTDNIGAFAYLFETCTSLTQAPLLPAETLADKCYSGMFYDCTSLTQAPELPATTLANNCYYYMFEGCTNLNNINVNFSAWNQSNSTTGWVTNVSSSGTFTCPADLPEEFGNDRIPTGWTVVRK